MFFQYEASSTVLHATKAMDRGSRPARKERFAVDVTELAQGIDNARKTLHFHQTYVQDLQNTRSLILYMTQLTER